MQYRVDTIYESGLIVHRWIDGLDLAKQHADLLRRMGRTACVCEVTKAGAKIVH